MMRWSQVVVAWFVCFCAAINQLPSAVHADEAAAGAEYTVVLRADGSVWGFGRNHYGQLGDGTTTQRLQLTQALLPVKAAAICAGNNHTLALDESGQVWSWGYNGSGQLGLGHSQPTNRPTLVPGLSDIGAIGAGGNYSLAAHRDGSLYVWGQNNQGQLGLGHATDTNRPSRLEFPGFQVAMIEGGTMHTLIVATNAAESRLYACGMNNDGQVGLGYTGSYTNRATWISGLSGICRISAGGNSSMAVLTNGDLYVWGSDVNGQLGLGGSSATNFPTRVTTLSNVAHIACGQNFSLACLNNGRLYGSGRNESGELGIDTIRTFYSYTSITEPSNAVFAAISAGNYHGAALDVQGTLWTWGLNKYGELGDGDYTIVNQPTPTSYGGAPALHIACGMRHVLALQSVDELLSWGENPDGQLGDGTESCRAYPQSIGRGYSRIAAGNNHSLALSNGQVYAWGDNNSGQLGLGYVGDQSLPTAVTLPMTAADAATGDNFSFAILTNGQLMSWGGNNSGQLGLGHSQNAYYPTNVGPANAPLTDIKQVAGGGAHTLAVKTNGSVLTWGYNVFGQLGKGNSANTNLPTVIEPVRFTNVAQTAAGGYHSLFLQNGEVWSCGYNGLGQLGLGNSSNTSFPTRIAGLSNVTRIAAGSYHGLALLDDRTVWSWGDNSYGQLGYPMVGTTSRPTRVSLLTNVVAIAAHDNVSAAIENDRIYVWGTDEHGQIGNGRRRWTPFNVDTVFAGLSQSGGVCRLRWNTGKQIVYEVFHRANLLEDAWTPLGQITSAAFVVDFPVTNALPGASGFFAVEQQ